MNDLAAIEGVFADFRLVKSQGVARLIVEVPIEKADAALTALGGLPRPDTSRWVAVARLAAGAVNPPSLADQPLGSDVSTAIKPAPAAPKPKREWKELPASARAALLCKDPQFQQWVNLTSGNDYAADEHEARSYLCARCGMTSRAQLDTNPDALENFALIERKYFSRNTPPPRTDDT